MLGINRLNFSIVWTVNTLYVSTHCVNIIPNAFVCVCVWWWIPDLIQNGQKLDSAFDVWWTKMPLSWSNFKHTNDPLILILSHTSFIHSLTHFTHHFAWKAICLRNSFHPNFVLIVLILCYNQYVLMFFLTRTTNYVHQCGFCVHVISKPANDIEQNYIAFRFFFVWNKTNHCLVFVLPFKWPIVHYMMNL